MLDLDTRTAILKLHEQKHGTRSIARALGISRGAVKRVIDSGQAQVPSITRDCDAEKHLDRIRQLYVKCQPNLIRVHEELQAEGVELSYSTLTRLCRKHDIGVKPKKASGRYDFGPGEESQHDTSPHDVKVGDKLWRLQCASIVHCFSRCIFAQVYPRFTRFHAKVFLTEASRYFAGTTRRIVVDNTSVLVAHGTGARAVFAPEINAWAERFGTSFMAHEKGDANRSARVERPFWYIETNFYKGRSFEDLRDLNEQLRQWCDKVNASYKPKLRFIPNDLREIEQPTLRALPLHVPEVYQLHQRLVDIEGYVTLHTNRYSVAEQLIHRNVQVHETKDRVRIFNGHDLVADHPLEDFGMQKRRTMPEHRRKRRPKQPPEPTPEHRALCHADPILAHMVERLDKGSGHSGVAVRRLFQLWRDYPQEPVLSAVAEALHYGLTDIRRIETMVIKRVSGEFFRLNQGECS